MDELALFAGAGGGQLASQWLDGHRTVCYVERDPDCVSCLKARIRDGLLDDAPIWDDARTFDGKPWRGRVDIISAGFPCQPFAAGGKQRGSDDPRNAWPATIRIIREVRPKWVFLENSPRLLSFHKRGETPPYIQQIVGELAQAGYVGQWGCLSAYALGADHKRARLWIVAHAGGAGRSGFLCDNGKSCPEEGDVQRAPVVLDGVWSRLSRMEALLGEPSVFRNDDGLARRVDRLRAAGQGQVPVVASAAWKLLSGIEG